MDATYTRCSIPLSVIADPAKASALRSALGLTVSEFDTAVLGDPQNDEPAGVDALAIRNIDGRPCLVWEKEACPWGGTSIEDSLITAGIPYLQHNGAGHEYGPSSTVFTGTESETIRLDHDLEPVVGIGVVGGLVLVDSREFEEFERYSRLRAAVLLYPALAPA